MTGDNTKSFQAASKVFVQLLKLLLGAISTLGIISLVHHRLPSGFWSIAFCSFTKSNTQQMSISAGGLSGTFQ